MPAAPSTKMLEDIVEPQNIRNPETVPVGCEDRTQWPYGDVDPTGFQAGLIDFRYLGIKYKANDLIGFGFDSTCSTCSNHYTVVFIDKRFTSTSYVIRDGTDYIFVLPIDNSITTGHDMCKYIVDELKRPENIDFIDHFQQYTYKDEQLFIFDNRPGTQLGSFFTSVHRLAVGLKAQYTGPGIKLLQKYDPNDVVVTLIWSDGTTDILTTSEWTPSSLTVSIKGPNTYIATYNDNPYLTAEYVVNGTWISSIKAIYKGPTIPVQEYYDTNDVEVIAIFDDGSTMLLSHDELKWETNLYINDNGLLRKFVKYIDITDEEFETDYFIPCVPRPILLKAKYLSVKKVEGSKIEKGEVRVSVTYLLNDFDIDHRQTEERFLQPGDWEFLGTDIVDEDNEGTLVIKWETDVSYIHFCFFTSIQVQFIDGTDYYLLAWYEGPEIEVGETYDIRHVIIYLCKPGEDRIQLHYLDPGVIMNRDTVIRKEGDNEYEVLYQYSRWLLKAKYYIPGVISTQYPDVGFQVIYIVKDTYEEIDLTEEFRPYFTYLGAFTISWNQFMLRIRDYEQEGRPYFGMFRVEAPKRTGLWNKYASSWHVYVFDNRNLKAEVYKVYCKPIKEDKDNGKTEEDVPNSSD